MNILITGASAGFGASAVKKLIAKGHSVIGIARREDKLLQLKQELPENLQENFYPEVLDLTDKDAISASAIRVLEKFGHIDVLINNAGLALGTEPAYQTNLNDWHTMVQTNILGLIDITHAYLPSMVERNFGHIINLGSTAGSHPYPGSNVYGSTKAFVKQFSMNLRADLYGKNVRVNMLAPGLCGGTEFSQVRFKGDLEKANGVYEGVVSLTPEDIADILVWLIELPPHINVNLLEVMPISQTFAGLKVAGK